MPAFSAPKTNLTTTPLLQPARRYAGVLHIKTYSGYVYAPEFKPGLVYVLRAMFAPEIALGGFVGADLLWSLQSCLSTYVTIGSRLPALLGCAALQRLS